MWFSYPNTEDWIPLKVDRVKEIMAMNKKGQKPVNLKEEAIELVSTAVVEKIPDYENVVGQDSLTRLDDKPRNKGSKNNNRNNNQNRNKNTGDRPEKGARPAQQPKNKPVANKKENVAPVAQASASPAGEKPAATPGQPGSGRNNRNRNNRRKKPADKPKNE